MGQSMTVRVKRVDIFQRKSLATLNYRSLSAKRVAPIFLTTECGSGCRVTIYLNRLNSSDEDRGIVSLAADNTNGKCAMRLHFTRRDC